MFKNALPCTAMLLFLSIYQLYGEDDSVDSMKDPIRLSRVELFPAGQGVFEYEATKTGDMELVLPLLPHELDDLLKSLVLKGFDTARVEFQPEVERNEIAPQLLPTDTSTTRAEILQRFKGIQVTIEDGKSRKTGSVVSIELQSEPAQPTPLEFEVITLNTEKGLEQVRLEQHTSVAICDPGLRREFDRALSRLGTNEVERSKAILKLKKKDIGNASIAFQTETSPWKCSYRIAMIDGQYQLVTAAVVDNTSGMDWTDIELVLVVDKPFGFHSPLGKVLCAHRDSMAVPTAFTTTPPKLAPGKQSPLPLADLGGHMAIDDPFAPTSSTHGLGGGGMGGMGGGGMQSHGSTSQFTQPTTSAQAYSESQNNEQSKLSQRLGLTIPLASLTNELRGERIQIRIPNVTIASGESQTVFLPSIPHSIRDVGLYVPSVHRQHPVAAFEVELKKGYQLMSGPGSVWNNEGYAGDVMFPRMISDVPQFITYSMEQSVTIDSQDQPVSPLPAFWKTTKTDKLQDLALTIPEERIVRYNISNESSRNKTILIEHTQVGNWTSEFQSEKSDRLGVNRFEVTIAAKSKSFRDVRETRNGTQTWTNKHSLDDLRVLVGRKDLSDNHRKLVAQWIDVLEKEEMEKKRVTALRSKLQSFTASIETSTQEQKRLQELMKNLSRGDELHSRLLGKLSTLEDQIEAARADIAKVQKELRKDSF